MSALHETFSPETRRRIVLIQTLTLVWMSVEAVVSLGAAWFAHSPALLGFGGDSAVNRLTHAALDPVSRMPEFKICAVRAEPGP